MDVNFRGREDATLEPTLRSWYSVGVPLRALACSERRPGALPATPVSRTASVISRCSCPEEPHQPVFTSTVGTDRIARMIVSRMNYGAALSQRKTQSLAVWLEDNAGRPHGVSRSVGDLRSEPLLGQLKTVYGLPGSASDDFLAAFFGAMGHYVLDYVTKPESVVLNQRPLGLNVESIEQNATQLVWTAHGLSPLGDSVALLADLGRFMRLVDCVRPRASCVVLAGAMWAANSLAAMRTGVPARDLLQELHFRRRLYSWLNIECEVWDYQFDLRPTATAIDYDELDRVVQHTLAISDGLLNCERPHYAVPNSETTDRAKHWYGLATDADWAHCSRLGLDRIVSLRGPLERLAKAVAKEFRTEIVLLHNLFEYFAESLATGQIEGAGQDSPARIGLTYILAQAMMQRTKSRSLKIGPITEKQFDIPFLDLYGDALEHAPTCVYLPHYQIGKHRVLSYTAVSIDVSKQREWESARQALILLRHHDKAHLEHVTAVVESWDVKKLAIVLGDLLSCQRSPKTGQRWSPENRPLRAFVDIDDDDPREGEALSWRTGSRWLPSARSARSWSGAGRIARSHASWAYTERPSVDTPVSSPKGALQNRPK